MKTKSKDIDLDDFFNLDDDGDYGKIDALYDSEQEKIERMMLEELLDEETPEKTPNLDELLEDYYEEDEVDEGYVIARDIRIAVSNIVSELEKSGKDLKNVDIIVRKVNGKYTARVDDKRDLKLKEIFKDEI